MNILFVLYGDLSTNTANPIRLFAQQLAKMGHECAIAIPSGEEVLLSTKSDEIRVYSYEGIFNKFGIVFSNNQLANVIHACTPRIGVLNFIQRYQVNWPTPLVIYLEDNEKWISQHFLGDSPEDLEAKSNWELSCQMPNSLSHPFDYPYFVAMADLVIVIQEKLKIEVPLFSKYEVIPWGVDFDFFTMDQDSNYLREKYQINSGYKVAVYHGGLNGFTLPAIRDLCLAILQINKAGVPCILLRTGINPINFWDDLPPYANEFIRDLGVLDRSELPGILSIADIFIQPGRINPFEDLRLPSKLLEFLAMGKPTLMPNVNIASTIRDGYEAILLQVGTPEEISASCLKLFSDPELMKNIGIQGRAYAKRNFDLTQQSLRLLNAYEQAIDAFDKDISSQSWVAANDAGMLAGALCRIRLLAKKAKNEGNFNQLFLYFQQQSDWFTNIETRFKAIGKRVITLDLLMKGAIEMNRSLNRSFSDRLYRKLKSFIKKIS